MQMHDATGMTWAQIVGEDKVSMKRLGTGNTEVQVAPIAGLVAATVMPTSTPTATGNVDGASIDEADTTYSGIVGTVHCLGTDCTVDGDGKLAGSWYFQPDSETAFHVKRTDDATTADVDESKLYEVETNYTRFGHWIAVDGTTGDVTVNTYAWSDGGATPDLVENADLDESATYSGTAVGMSLHKTFDSQGEQQSIASGRFTAHVELTADFDATPTVEGTIDNFQGPATDSSWTVELKSMTLATTRGTAGDTSTGGTGADGQWNHQAYGEANKRPTGIFGDFTAHWTDGHAAGAYATRRDE